MKRYILLIILFGLLTIVSCGKHAESKAIPAQDTVPMMVMQIQQCSRLYTSEYQLHKIVTYSDTMSLRGRFLQRDFSIDLPTGKRRIAIPVTATVKASVDLSTFTEANIRRHGKKIEVILPDPVITMTATTIDHNGVREKVSFFRSHFSDEEVTSIQQQGRKDIIRTLPSLNIIEDARQSAARQLIPILEQLGYDEQDITITFRKNFSPENIINFIRETD